ncbi:MAG: hypothetical protein QM723_01640 [Myxococcaceae bacterium]
MIRLSSFAVATWLIAGCATLMPSAVPEASGPFKPTGRVMNGDRVAEYDDCRVRGPRVNMTKRTDGSWYGTLFGWDIEVTVNGRRLESQKLTEVRQGSHRIRAFDVSEGDALVMDAELDHLKYHWELRADRVVYGDGLAEQALTKNPDGSFGNPAQVRLEGDGAEGLPPWPQIAFALFATQRMGRGDRIDLPQAASANQ